jgi:large subunit ribosomal protein L21e
MGCGRARGVRRNTRDMFAKGFGNKGLPSMTTYMTPYKLGDYVDIVVNGAIHKGMPYRFYHGRTGKVWNITKSAIGVMVNKQVRGRIIAKRIHVRIEHVKQSRCTEEFKNRVAKNEKAKSEAKRTGGASRPPLSVSLLCEGERERVLLSSGGKAVLGKAKGWGRPGMNGGKKGALVLCSLGASYRARRQEREKYASSPISFCAKAWDFFH